MIALTSLVKDNWIVFRRVFKESQQNADFGDGIVGTTCNGDQHHWTIAPTQCIPVCPLTPRAAPVAVKKTIASRSSWMFANNADFSSAVS